MSTIDKDQLRITHLAETDAFSNKPRHGYFSVPISTAIADDGPYRTKLHPRNQIGKPQTEVRNFQTSPTRSGQMNKSYLGLLNSLATSPIKDQYIEVPKRLIKEDHEARKLSKHQRVFYPSSNYKLQHRPAYQYKQQNNPQKNPKRNREEDGRVKVKPRQLQTNIQSKVISDYFKPINNMSDPFSRAHDIEWQRQKKERSKEGQAVFRPNKFEAGLLNSDRSVFNDHQIKRSRYEKKPHFNILKHESRWRDTNQNRKGLYGFFTPFPQYMENPLREVKRIDHSSEKEIFKAMNRTTLGIPSPSITQHPRNIARSLNHSFSHRP